MNANHFAELLQDSSRLYQISYQALKTLVLQYPYSPNLRFLLLVKSKMENHKEYDRNLKSAALYAPSRSFLFHLLERIETSLPLMPNAVGQPVMELKDLRELRGDLEALEIDTTSEDVMLQAMEANLPVAISATTTHTSIIDQVDEEEDWESITGLEGSDVVSDVLEEPDTVAPSEKVEKIAQVATEVETVSEDFLDLEDNLHIPEEEIALSLQESVSPIEEIIEPAGNDTSDNSAAPIVLPPLDLDALWEMEDEEATPTLPQTPMPVKTAVPAPMPRTAFMPQWHLEAIEEEEEEERIDAIEATAKKSNKKDKKMSESAQLAAASLEEQEDVASETLAQLLVSQGYSAKAIRIYERLSLQNPEKSEIFASAIARIQEK